MGYRVDNLTAADRRVNERLTIIAARAVTLPRSRRGSWRATKKPSSVWSK